ncbi:hypothetical protein M3Y98_00505600 [Aphelenchoides besseyi]|nr:hypothetical protein M3Y98_00505600 [Aphelenchoides besseyi]
MSSLMGYDQTHQTPNSASGVRLLPCSSGSNPTVHNFTPAMSNCGLFFNSAYASSSNTAFGVHTTDSSTTSSISSSRTRLQCSDDSGNSTDSQLKGLPQALATGVYNDGQFAGTDDTLEPVSRDRCNTWPLRRPNLDLNAQTSPLMHERIVEEGSLYDSDENLHEQLDASQPPPLLAPLQSSQPTEMDTSSTPSPGQFANDMSSAVDYCDIGGSDSPLSSKKSTTRRNAWGNMSYADLITQAILSSPEKRLTLSQVYEYMVANEIRIQVPAGRFSSFQMDESMDLIDEPPAEFRLRCRTWPSNTEAADDSSGIGTPSTVFTPVGSIARLPSIGVLENGAENGWSPNSSGPSADSFYIDTQSISTDSTNRTKRSRRRNTDLQAQRKANPWGEESYAELIIKALESAPEGRLRLNEIYVWFTQNVPYFHERSSAEDSAGWKNSIRHNLSLHSRFMRVQNEGAGKSSWWVINPDAKPGRNPRRRASTMDTNTKQALEKKRRGARKRVEMQMHGSTRVLPQSDQNYEVRDEADDSDYCSTFRSRTLSNISAPGGSQISPVFEPANEESKYSLSTPLQQPMSNSGMSQPSESGTIFAELLDRTDQIRLDTDIDFTKIVSMDPPQQIGGYQRQQPTLVSPTYVKQEANSFQHSHPYQELNVARGNGQLRNPLLPSQQPRYTQQAPVQQNSGNSYPQQHFPVQPQTSGVYYEQQTSSNYPPNTHGQWTGDRNVIQVQDVQYAQPSMQQSNVYPHGQTSIANNSNLPSDLESINAFDFDVDGILKQYITSSNSFEM